MELLLVKQRLRKPTDVLEAVQQPCEYPFSMFIMSLCLLLTRPQRACDALHNGVVDHLLAQALRERGHNLNPSASIFS